MGEALLATDQVYHRCLEGSSLQRLNRGHPSPTAPGCRVLHRIEKPRPERIAHQGLLDRGELKKGPEQPAHECMCNTLRVVEELVLEGPSFKGLEDDPLEGRLRQDHPPPALHEGSRLFPAGKNADAAAEA